MREKRVPARFQQIDTSDEKKVSRAGRRLRCEQRHEPETGSRNGKSGSALACAGFPHLMNFGSGFVPVR
ncbi:hypothetical protein ACWEC4_45045 [Streptomyces sp. NPDC005055]